MAFIDMVGIYGVLLFLVGLYFANRERAIRPKTPAAQVRTDAHRAA